MPNHDEQSNAHLHINTRAPQDPEGATSALAGSEHADASEQLKIIYTYKNEANDGYKVGEHSIAPSKDISKYSKQELIAIVDKGRVKQQHQTANVSYEIVDAEIAIDPTGKTFSDAAVRNKIRRMGGRIISRGESKHGAQEWVDAPLSLIQRAIKSLRDGVEYPAQDSSTKAFEPREEQERCARKIRDAFLAGHLNFLLAAKPRFGKTATILYFVKLWNAYCREQGLDAEIKRITILTHRPVVNDSWAREALKLLGAEFRYESRSPIEGVETYDLFSSSDDEPCIRFLSLQDLRGKDGQSGDFKERTKKFLETEYDLLIIDEGQEGISTELAKQVLDQVKAKFRIVASGTAYGLLAQENNPYSEENRFIWEYPDEQAAKDKFYAEHPNEPNPYANMPQMVVHTLDISNSLSGTLSEDQWFTLSEFWRVDSGKFVNDPEIDARLDKMFKQEEMPYSALYRDQTRHSLWCVPSDNAAKLLAEKLRKHDKFKDYEIIKVSGDSEGVKDPLARVRAAIGDRPWETKTITVTVGRLTVGTTVPAWGAVLMLADGSSANSYIQTLFRAQSPCEDMHGPGMRKTECHGFDFSPDRTLQVVVELANAGSSNSGEAQARMDQLSMYMPILMSDGITTTPLNSDRILEEINTVFIKRAAERGLDAGSPIFNMAAILRDNTDDLLNEIRKATGDKAASGKSSRTKVDVNKQGLDKSPGSSGKSKGSGAKRQKTLDKQRKEQEEKAKSELAKISIALPRLVLGAATELSSDTIDQLKLEEFPDLFSEDDWNAFMGNVNKDLFLRALKYFNEDVLRGTLKRMLLDVEEAMNEPPLERSEKLLDVLSRIKNPHKEVVFTPRNVADNVFDHTNISFPEDSVPTFYDPNIKSGIFPLLATKRITDQYGIEFSEACRYIYGNAPTEAARYTTLKILGIDRGSTLADNFSVLSPMELKDRFLKMGSPAEAHKAVAGALLILNKGRARDCGEEDKYKKAKRYYDRGKWDKLYALCSTIDEEMRFNYLVGNPPYTIFTNSGTGTQVYLDFLVQGSFIADNVGMVFLSSWHNNKPLAKSRQLMRDLEIDKRFVSLRSFKSSADLFPTISEQGIDIISLGPDKHKGATQFFQDYAEKPYMTAPLFSETTGFVVKDPTQDAIVKKVISHPDFTECAPEDWLHKIQNDVMAHSKSGGASTEDFLSLLKESSSKNRNIRVGMPSGGSVSWLYGEKKAFKTHVPKGKFAVVFSHASDHINGITNDRQLICTEFETVRSTMASVFDSPDKAYRFWRLSRTKFFALLMESRLTSHHTYPQAYAHVPQIDLSDESFIDWDGSVEDINRQLCDYYKLTKKEQAAVNGFEYVFSHPMNEYNRKKLTDAGVTLHKEDAEG